MILANQRELVAAWVASRVKGMSVPVDKYEAIGVLRGTELIGGVIYSNFKDLPYGGSAIEMDCAGEPGWLTRHTLREFFRYPFCQLQVVRITTMVAKANRRARDLNKRLGFKEEGCVRNGFGGGRDMIIYGMLRPECRWIED
jgi:RimJ/RimL family protein N-acetyltransferase